MTHLQWYDFMRMVTACLATLTLYRGVNGNRFRWRSFNNKDKDYLWAYYALIFLQLEGSLEAIARNRGWSAATLLSFLITMVCVKASRKRFLEDAVVVENEDN